MRSLLRYVAVGLLLLAAAAVLVRRPRASANVPGDFVTILYWEKWTGPEADAMRRVVDRFNRTVGAAKKIHVEFASMSQVDQKTLVATAAGVPPDVAGLWDAQLAQFASMDALEPLDALAAERGITAAAYKPVYWNGCTYRGKLWALVSTPAAVALHYNKQAFIDAGLDPEKTPTTLAELDQYAQKLTTYETVNGRRRIARTGYLPMEPGWYIAQQSLWFGGDVFDPATNRMTIDSPPVNAAFGWIADYSRKYGKEAISEFRSGLGSAGAGQDPFYNGVIAMELQGPWTANLIEHEAPALNRWHVPAGQLKRESLIPQLRVGLTRQRAIDLLGVPTETSESTAMWDAGVRRIRLTFNEAGEVAEVQAPLLPAVERRKFCQWGAAAFPSAVPGQRDVTLCPFDALVIPRGCKHPREAFEFIAFVNRQDVMESLCADHCKNSPLKTVSRDFIDYHPNPYIQVFEDLADSANAHPVPSVPIWPEVADELSVAAQKCCLLSESPAQAVKSAAARIDEKWAYFQKVQATRRR